MEISEIIELANKKNYLILDDCEYDDNIYYLSVEVDANDEPTDRYKLLKYTTQGSDGFVEEVVDEITKTALIAIFTVNYEHLVTSEID